MTFAEAALGATRARSRRRAAGSVSLKVPAGSQDGRTLRVRGKGAPRLKGGQRRPAGASCACVVPAKLSKDRSELVEKLGGDVRPTRARRRLEQQLRPTAETRS